MKLIGTKRAAEILGVPTRTLRRWAATEHKIPVAVAPGDAAGAYLFDEAEIIALRDQRLSEARAELDALEASA